MNFSTYLGAERSEKTSKFKAVWSHDVVCIGHVSLMKGVRICLKAPEFYL